jgi:tetratricopeptide (TPR) repeat protein
MLEEHNKRDKKHLIDLIGRRSNNTPNFSLLIGAGASASSGVKTTGQMIVEWRRRLYEQSKSEEPFEVWLQKQDWYEDEEEYSILFEKVCDQRSQRRIYIEECVKDAKPSWGYIYLANITAHNYFNVIFTPNFDDLLNEACFIYADCRPIVCAHDSAVADIRVTSARPKIIKLHGDFLYDSIKNTIRETETLEKNMRDKFMQFAREYGLVVIGYGGNDRSIMDILDTMLRSEGYFPNGLYWCIQDKDKISKKLERLMRRENAYWIEIEGFDEFMAELHNGLGLTLPNAVRDPYKATTEMLNRFILPSEKVKHPIIKDDITKLEGQIKRFEQIIFGKVPIEEFDRLVPYRFLADAEYKSGNYEKALPYFEKALIQNPNNVEIMLGIGLSYLWTENYKKALEISEKMINKAPDYFWGYYLKGLTLNYLWKPKDAIAVFNEALKHTTEDSRERHYFVLTSRAHSFLVDGNWQNALSDAEKALQSDPKNYIALVNKCVALKKMGRKEEAIKILQAKQPEIKRETRYNRALAFAVLDDKKNMLEELKAAIKENNTYRIQAKGDFAWADYREDPDFRKLVYEGQEQEKIVKKAR